MGESSICRFFLHDVVTEAGFEKQYVTPDEVLVVVVVVWNYTFSTIKIYDTVKSTPLKEWKLGCLYEMKKKCWFSGDTFENREKLFYESLYEFFWLMEESCK